MVKINILDPFSRDMGFDGWGHLSSQNKNSFSTYNYKDVGLASSASIILFLFILFFTLINFFITGNRRKGGLK